MSHCKRPCHGCLYWPAAQGFEITAFNPLATQRCVLCRQQFSSLVCQAVELASHAYTPKVYQQCWKELDSWDAQEGVPK